MHKNVFTLLLFAGMLQGCNSEHGSDPKPVLEIQLDPSMVGNFNYQPGSYWRYKDSVTGEMAYANIATNVSGTGRYENEHNIQQIHTICANGDFRHSPSVGVTTANFQYYLVGTSLLFGYSNCASSQPYQDWAMYFVPMAKQPVLVQGNVTYKYIPSMTVNGHIYTDVYHSAFNQQDELWLSESSGLVKIHFRHPAESSLDRVYELDSVYLVK